MTTDIIAGKYKIIREIARSNDVVYEAVDTEMGRRIALKELVIPPNLTGQPRRERIERFHREARASGKLSHPNIVTVYGYGEDNGRYYIAMEYLEGASLRDTLQTRGALPVQEAVEIACQMLSALAHAHAHQVIHRDVKPDNVHILPGGQVKLTDFGIARLTEEASLTGEGQVFGTPSYMSPEQIKGHHIDFRSDIFSLAIMLYEMIAGRKPFTGDSVISITYAIMEAQPPPLQGISYGLEQAIFKALNKDSIRRFGSADEMRNALRNADSVQSAYAPMGSQTGMGAFGGFGGGFPAPQPAGGPAFPSYGGYSGSSSGGILGGGGSFGGGTFGGGGLAGGVIPGGHSGHTGTVYSPPPAAAPPQQSAGPFVNWGQGNPNNPALAAPPPPFPRPAAGPVLSEGAKTFLKAVVIAMLIGVVILGGVLLFINAFEKQKSAGASAAVLLLVEDGKKAFAARDYQGAVDKFEAAMAGGQGTDAADVAKKSLVVVYNRMGQNAYEAKDYRTAESLWFKAYNLDPTDQEVNKYLQQAYDRIGSGDQALQEWRNAKSASASDNPAAPGNDARLQSRLDEADQLYKAGEESYNRGDMDTARADWSRVIELATGTQRAEQARSMLAKMGESGTSGSPYLGQ